MASWRHMATSKEVKDGRPVLLLVDGEPFVGEWQDDRDGWYAVEGGYRLEPTNWIAIPPLPPPIPLKP